MNWIKIKLHWAKDFVLHTFWNIVFTSYNKISLNKNKFGTWAADREDIGGFRIPRRHIGILMVNVIALIFFFNVMSNEKVNADMKSDFLEVTSYRWCCVSEKYCLRLFSLGKISLAWAQFLRIKSCNAEKLWKPLARRYVLRR